MLQIEDARCEFEKSGATRECVTWRSPPPTITWFIDCRLWFTYALPRSPMHSNRMLLIADEWSFMSRVSHHRSSWDSYRRFTRSSDAIARLSVAEPWRLCFVCVWLTSRWRVRLQMSRVRARVCVWVRARNSVSLNFRKRFTNVRVRSGKRQEIVFHAKRGAILKEWRVRACEFPFVYSLRIPSSLTRVF